MHPSFLPSKYLRTLCPLFSRLTVTLQMDDDFQMNIAKKVTDSRKKVEEGVAKGLMRLCSTYEQ
jgi:hypothetical protein